MWDCRMFAGFDCEIFLALNCSKFAAECDWNGKISQKVRNLGFLRKRLIFSKLIKVAGLLQNAYQMMFCNEHIFLNPNWEFSCKSKTLRLGKKSLSRKRFHPSKKVSLAKLDLWKHADSRRPSCSHSYLKTTWINKKTAFHKKNWPMDFSKFTVKIIYETKIFNSAACNFANSLECLMCLHSRLTVCNRNVAAQTR